jgi:phage shock protein PspC (stress-responsive transcriptional regulator)
MTMKKVININFQGRVVPIEETAYELLKQYIESLRRYFANEDGRDEIINDIESRIAELFSERLKKGATCITDDDVNAVIAGMGRPEDLEAEAAEPGTTTNGSKKQQSSSSQQSSQQQSYTYATNVGRRLYRNADDKIIGGVASGLANYFNIDPVIMRIIFVVLLFFGGGFLLYIILWIVIPAKSLRTNITKRLYRSADSRVVGGVCAGLAAYFNTDVWIPRLVFALPLIIAIVSGPFGMWWNDWHVLEGPKILTGSLSGTLFVAYIILWIAVPVANTAAEKLEMKGEKVDVSSISKTVKEDLSNLKSKAQAWGQEVAQTAQQYGQSAGAQIKSYAAEAGPVARSAGNGIGHVIGVLFKAFFLFVAGCIAVALFGLLMAILFGGFAVFPLKNFILDGAWQNALAWISLICFLGVPVVALIIWLVRRIMGVRSKNHYLGFVFGGLWTIGLIATVFLAATVTKNYKSGSVKTENLSTFVQPAKNKLYVDVERSDLRYYGGDWFGIDWDDDWPFYGVNQDTLLINSVRVNIERSTDSAFHVEKVTFSRGRTPEQARTIGEKVKFEITQQDSVLVLPKGFPISSDEKFRGQSVLVVIKMPVGKRIELSSRLHQYSWFGIDNYRGRRWDGDWDNNFDRSYGWQSNVEYIMTPNGLERVDRLDPKELKKGNYKVKPENDESVDDNEEPRVIDRPERKQTDTNKGYRYKQDNKGDNKNDDKKDSTANNQSASVSHEKIIGEERESIAMKNKKHEPSLEGSLSVFSRLF